MSELETIISLESYAAVMAGLGAGLDLWRALAHAGVPPAAWERGCERWQARIDESAASDLALLVDFDAALLIAKRRFEPTFEPIESDVRAWANFRRHFVTAADPIAFLSRHELPLATYARVEASWANRVLMDEALAAALRSHMEGPLEECPALTRRPSPLLAAAGVEMAAMPAGAPSEARPDEAWRSAPLSAGQALAAAAGAPAVGTPAVRAPAVGAQAVAQPPAMVPARVADPIVEPPPPPSMREERAVPASALKGATTAMAAVPFADSLPFQPAPQGQAPAEESPPPIPLERYAVMLADHMLFGMTEAQLCEKHRLTAAQRAQAFQYWQGRISADPALQGRVRAVVTRYQAARTKAGERAPASSAAPLPAIAQAQAPPAVVSRVDFGSTVDPRQVVMSPVLPFVAGSSPPSKPTGGPRESVDHGATLAPGAAGARAGGKSADPLPFVSPAPTSAPASQPAPPSGAAAASTRGADGGAGGAGGAGQLSLEQYASFTVDLALEPERAPETVRRYGLTPAQRTLVDATWTARLAQNPAERSAFEAACASYRAWRLRSTNRP
ncbi:hypothetical protein WMF04_18345 [Sorangium sp. So ce260]|uniref:hypothetical protein n=1 Tax=Sorangium sp. So ce260 TaxID=3133291 RepID=UPI003F60437F